MKHMIRWLKKAGPADWAKLILKLLPHAAIILSGVLLVFFAIDRVNKPMGFMTGEFHKVVTAILSVLCVYLAVSKIRSDRARERAEYRRRLKAAGKGIEK